MFDRRSLSPALATVRVDHAPGAAVLDTTSDFDTLDPAIAEALGPIADAFDPITFPADWLPPNAPGELYRYAGDEFVIGMPGDGGVAWTAQTVPPTVFVKPRLQSSPDPFVEFLIAEALVEAGLGVPEHFLGFFEDRYRHLASAIPLDPGGTYQLAVALYDAYVGLHTRAVFADWADRHDALHAAWQDAGDHLAPRLAALPSEVATGRTGFATAAELACNAVKHDADLPPPFAALDTAAYRSHGPEYAVQWAETTFEKLHGEDSSTAD